MRKLMLLLVIVGGLFAQTPCIEQAKAGLVGECLNTQVNVSDTDAKFVPVQVISGYQVAPGLPRNLKLEFSTLEQAQAVAGLIGSAAQAQSITVELSVKDYAGQFYFPPFRKLQYGNDGSLFAPRLYNLVGTIGGSKVEFSVGWFVNVIRLIYGGNFETQELGLPFGNSKLVLVLIQGRMAPAWVGEK